MYSLLSTFYNVANKRSTILTFLTFEDAYFWAITIDPDEYYIYHDDSRRYHTAIISKHFMRALNTGDCKGLDDNDVEQLAVWISQNIKPRSTIGWGQSKSIFGVCAITGRLCIAVDINLFN